MRVLYVVGTRPNFVKMAPVIAALRRRLPEATHSLVHTGQHYDRLMSEVFIDELAMPPPDHFLGIGSGTHSEQVAGVIRSLAPILASEDPDLVLVPGDVNSTLGAALCAAKAGVPVAHIESGLRSFDLTMPEETNRIVTDHLAELCFLHSDEAAENLHSEGVEVTRLRFVGNTMIDTLVALQDRFSARRAAAALGLDPGEYLLVTLHRPALVDGPLLAPAMDALVEVARRLPVVFPVHPRTRKMLGAVEHRGVLLIDPVGYLDFLSLESTAAAVLTDSGGIQEETTFLGVPCFTLRENTERPVTVRVGTNTVLGLEPARIAEIPRLLEASGERTDAQPPPAWDGHAAERVAEAVAVADWTNRGTR